MDTVQETVRLLVKGHKGQKARSGLRDRASRVVRCRYTEDFRREASQIVTAKRSLRSIWSALERFENDSVVSIETLIAAGVVKNPKDGVKVLGCGELTKKLTVQANAFSASAAAKIEALGGKAEVI